MPKYEAQPRYPLLAVVLVVVRITAGLSAAIGIVALIDATGISTGRGLVSRMVGENTDLLVMIASYYLAGAISLLLFAGIAAVLMDSEKHLRVLASIANAHEIAGDAVTRHAARRGAGSVGDGSREL